MFFNFNLNELAVSRKQHDYSQKECVNVANEIIKNGNPITVSSFISRIDDQEYFSIESSNYYGVSIPASKHNSVCLLQYMISGKTENPLLTTDESEESGDKTAMLSIAQMLMKAGQKIKMVPAYRANGYIIGRWHSAYATLKFRFEPSDDVKQIFANNNHAV